MNPPEASAELAALCDKLVGGELTLEERARIEELVTSDPRLRMLYVERMRASLAQKQAGIGEMPFGSGLHGLPDDMEDDDAGTGVNWFLRIAAGVALATGIIWIASQENGGGPIATIIETKETRWGDSSLPTMTGSRLEQGRLRLVEGGARIRFGSGAEVSIEGPADLEVTGRNACFLHAGTLTADVPEKARGFTVETPERKWIDPGTHFSVSVDPEGRAQVRELEGK